VLHHIVKPPFFINQLHGLALLYDSAFMHHDDLIVVGDGLQSMGNCDHCRVLQFFPYDCLDKGIRLVVQR
jgi:hypothetical protein